MTDVVPALRNAQERRPERLVNTSTLPPVLLTNANYSGTVAAVRALGRSGIRVVTADPSRFAVGAWSKYTATRVRCPDVRADAFLEWLYAYGRNHEPHVLLPTSDDTAWLYSLHRDELSRHFHLSVPPVEVMYRLLNKKALSEEATAVGLHVPRTWFPEDVDDLDVCLHEARFPLLVKPRTQVLFSTQSKGAHVETPDQLEFFYRLVAGMPHGAKLLARDADASRPMIQEFYPGAATGIYNISAYVQHGRLCGARAARKLLQQPRRLGTGVCFEEAPVLPELASALERLAARVGFCGVFEAEFIQTADRALLIDFNPRFYNQMAFDVDRGLPLPLLAYHDAVGNRESFARLCETLPPPPPRGRVYVDLISLRVLLGSQRLSGALSRAETKEWTDWYDNHRDDCTYAIRDGDDRLPFYLAALQSFLRYVRHPREFLRSMVLSRYCLMGSAVSGI